MQRENVRRQRGARCARGWAAHVPRTLGGGLQRDLRGPADPVQALEPGRPPTARSGRTSLADWSGNFLARFLTAETAPGETPHGSAVPGEEGRVLASADRRGGPEGSS